MEPEIQPSEPPIPDVQADAPARSRICGFWSRLAAFVLDALIIGSAGFLLGVIAFDYLAAVGGWGRVVGFFIAAPYFVVLSSSLGSGQTVGMRVMKIRVVDYFGNTIAPHKSLLRYCVFGVPFFLNGAALPQSWTASVLGQVVGFIVFVGNFAIIYLYVFNRTTRQSLHDLATGTYVVDASGRGEVLAGTVWRGHWLVLGTCSVAVIGFSAFVAPRLFQSGPFPQLFAIQQKLAKSSNARQVSVFMGKFWGPGGESRYVTVTALWKEPSDDYGPAALQLADVALKSDPSVMQQDFLGITIIYGFDIGIARASKSYSEQHSPKEWQEKIAKAGISSGP